MGQRKFSVSNMSQCHFSTTYFKWTLVGSKPAFGGERTTKTRQEMYCDVTLKRVRYDCCHGKAMSIISSECVSVALVFQHAMRVCCITHIFICGLPYFCIISFHKNVIDHKMCVLIFSTSSVWNIFHSKKNWARYDQTYTYIGLHVRYVLLLWYTYLTAVGLTPGGSSTSHIYTQTIHIIHRKENNTEKGKIGKCGPCPVFANYTLTFALQLRKKHGKTSVKVAQY
jgi:hypothetical protein